jgi:hypothetical protein
MNKIVPFIVLIITILFIGCSNNRKPTPESEVSKKIPLQILDLPESSKDTLKASYISDTVTYIPLETTQESFMDNIERIWVNDSFILICCSKAGLLLFSQDGKFLRKIGKFGRGPGEYGSIFQFDVIRDTIYVSSTGRRGFLRYTFDGVFCDEIKLNYQPIFFSTTVDQKLTCYIPEEGKIFAYNKNLHMPPDTIIAEYGVTEGRYRYVPGSDKTMTYLQKYSTGLLFNDYRSDTIWNITGNKKEPAYIINMENKLPYDRQIEFCKGNLKWWSEMVKSYQFVHLIPFPSMMFIYQRHWRGGASGIGFDAIYLRNATNGEIKKYNNPTIYDDIVSGQRLWVYDYIYSKDYLGAIAYPPEEDPKQNKNVKAILSPLWLDLTKTVKKDDNPFLVKIKLKKNLK